MPIDLKQLQQSFIEESIEMLENMEKLLLKLDLKEIDVNIVNDLFRTVHSLKSSSAIFDFTAFKDLSHILENRFEFIRSTKRKIDENERELFLKSVDCLRNMVADIQHAHPIVEDCTKELIKKLSQEESSVSERSIGLRIFFRPERHFWNVKDEPYRLFNTLSQLGKLEIEVETKFLPSFGKFNPKECYLAWNLSLFGNVEQDEVQEIFEWVTDKKNVEISYLKDSSKLSKEILQEDVPGSKKNLNINELNKTKTTIRVATEKIDELINIVGELIITKSVLRQISKDLDIKNLPRLQEELEHLDVKSRELQETAMRMRMVPIGFAFNRLPRLAKELANQLGKEVNLIISGEQTELDRTIMEKMADPLMHLVRNAIDHGIEIPEEREKLKKNKIGTIKINAYQQEGRIVIDVWDDGKGLNKEKIHSKAIDNRLINKEDILSDEALYQLIFKPGFSTADHITDVSGRGIGMNVVLKNIDITGGTIEIQSKINEGTLIRLILPLTLAIMDCQLVKVYNQIFVIPLISINGITKLEKSKINYLDTETELYHFDEQYIPIVRLSNVFSLIKSKEDLSDKFIIIISIGNRPFCFVVDEVLAQQQVVIKSFEENYRKIQGISGATILGDGSIALIIDPNGVIEIMKNPEKRFQVFIPKEVIKRSLDLEQKNIQAIQLLTFFMHEKEYGVNILEVNDIQKWIQPTPLPNAPSYIQGIINQRGTIVPVIDLYEYFRLGTFKYGPDTAVIILTVKERDKERLIGIVVDAVSDIYQIKAGEIMPVSDCHHSEVVQHARGLVASGKKLITFLSINDLLPIENLS